ncbi:MAG TPA: tetratricopeptide repeat protein [Rhodocyclaceae bacterium]|nr:tetratricopeptide repeat protein [Rhodocyclaceae bacterium]HNH34846.1 tetratricopeptide repeat protein [Rhodocyclaceae bacterium]
MNATAATRPGWWRRDRRLPALVATVIAVAAGGWFLDRTAVPDPAAARAAHADQKIRAEIDERFRQGVVMLHARQYEHAMTAFHRVLQLAPRMPEAHVNAGFALIGLKRPREARDFFEAATALRPGQVNAYYGLAVACEGLGDLEAATGAMQTYVHLAPAQDPYRRKAEAALWEWQSRRQSTPARNP